MIPDDVVDEVRARADIVDIIGEHVALKRAGKDFKARCPFHEERTPSFYVVPSKGFYKCFGCNESGDVFTFLMKRLGLSFVDAVKAVAVRVGVEVRDVSRQGGEDPHRHLHEANSFAQEFFKKALWDRNAGRPARAYLKKRGIGRDAVERFDLGFAPDEWRSLREGAAVHGIEDPVLLEVGLLVQREIGKEPYDRFRNRIIFPIQSASGRTLAFGGRILGQSGKGAPKYLNSPETPVYHKGEVLYGLSWGKNAIRREEGGLVVEGYMDAVSLAAGGIENVVAPLGTSMTEDQAKLLARYCTKVFLLFDSDAAGLKATFRAGDVLLAAGLHPS
ncbi:MAG: DNA primase, partial [Gemmatimonadetes bacterium]|nr:DNA primase [Gemmatimonadota bacterium]